MAEVTIFYHGPIVTRQEAKARGEKRYFTGLPCRRGHVAQRSEVNQTCFACKALSDKIHYRNHANHVKQRSSRWRELNSARYKKQNQGYYQATRASVIARKKKWREANPAHVRAKSRAYNANRKARILEVGGTFTVEDVQRLLTLQGHKCGCCRKSVRNRYHVDHIVPLSCGGSNAPPNLQILCPGCNWSKHDKDPIDFMRERGFLL